MSVNEKLRRLSMRGNVKLHLDMVQHVARQWADIEHHPPRWPHGPARYSKWLGHTTYNQVPSPVWRVSIDKFKRSYPEWATTQIKAFVWDSIGSNSEYAEGPDLEVVLDKLLDRTRPTHVDPMVDYCPGQYIWHPEDRLPGEPEFAPKDVTHERSQ